MSIIFLFFAWIPTLSSAATRSKSTSTTSTQSTTTTTSMIPDGAPKGSSTTTTVANTTTTLTQLRLPKSGQCTILEIGDSVGSDLGGGLFTELRSSPKIHLDLASKPSTGLSNAWYYNWPVHLKALLQQVHPELTIVLLGGNDEQGIDVDDHSAYFGEPAWRTQYAKNVALMMNEATAAGSEVLWVGMPVMAPQGYSEGMQIINSIFAKEAKAVAGVTFLPTWNLFASKNGGFQSSAYVNGVEQTIREPDGIHPTVVGENVLATYVVEKLHTIYGLPAKPAYPEVFTN
jgi:hypothetical protein